jgi:hypothetical protein
MTLNILMFAVIAVLVVLYVARRKKRIGVDEVR